jgi:hypothetical protein
VVKGKCGDWTVHVVAGVDPEDNLYILDLWRKQTTTDVSVEAFLDLADQHKPMVWAEEDDQIIKSLGPFIDRRSQERRVFATGSSLSVADKPTRCRSSKHERRNERSTYRATQYGSAMLMFWVSS